MSIEYNFDYTNDVPTYMQMAHQTILAIAEGRLLENEVLPSSRRTTENIGLSPVTINRATTFLRTNGFVKVRPGIGAFVGVKQDPKAELQHMQYSMRVMLARCMLRGVKKEEVHEMIDEMWKDFKYDKDKIYE